MKPNVKKNTRLSLNIILQQDDLHISHLKPLDRNSDGEEDTAGQTDVWETLCYGEDFYNECVVKIKGNRSNEDGTEKEHKVRQAEAGKEDIKYIPLQLLPNDKQTDDI